MTGKVWGRRRGAGWTCSILAIAAASSAAPASAQVRDNQGTGDQASVPVRNEQGQGDQASTTEAQEPGISDVIVQARRTDERQQDVPIAISTVSGDRLTNAAATSVNDVQRLVPALQIGQDTSNQQVFTIRGAFGGFGNDPAVITYVDEVPIASRTLVYNIYDLASVQVLKGSQGTLFGRNSTGGAVLFVSRRPDLDAAGGYVIGRYGNLDDRRVEGALNLPLSSTFGVRVAGELQRRDGYIKSVTVPGLEFGNRHNESLRASALWRPSSRIEDVLEYTHDRLDEHNPPQQIVSLAGPCTGPATPAPVCLYQPPFSAILRTGDIRAYFNQEQGLPSDETVNNNPNTNYAKHDAVTNNLTVDLGPLSVRNILFYGKDSVFDSKDYDGTPVRVFDETRAVDTETFYTETQLFGKLFADKLDWRVGGVFSRDTITDVSVTAVFPLPTSITQPRNGVANQDFRSYALFGQTTLDLSGLLNRLALTGGFRYTWDDRSMDFSVRTGQPTQQCALQTLPVPATGAVPYPNTDLATCTRHETLNSSSYNYNLTLDWKPVDRVLLYAAARRGYKSGSFNLLSNRPDLISYAPETVQDLEAGLKADWRIGAVPFRANIAAFRSKYHDIQVSSVLINPANGDINVVIVNRDVATGTSNRATIKGFEIEGFMKPWPGLELSAFYSRLDSKYDQFIIPGGTSLAGQKVAGTVPETWGFSILAQRSLDSHAVRSIDLTASYYVRGRPQVNATTTLIEENRPALDARLALRDLFGSGVDLAAYARNLGDIVRCPINTAVTGGPTKQCGEPRTYGLELTARFGSERR